MQIIISVLLPVIIIFSSVAAAQDEPSDMSSLLSQQSLFKCPEFMYNATLLIPQLHADGSIDSVHTILGFLEEECGTNSRLFRTRMLLSIEERSFSEDIYDVNTIDWLLFYRYVSEFVQNNEYWPYNYALNPNDTEADLRYYNFTSNLASNLVSRLDTTSLEYMWCRFYSNDFDYFFSRLQTNEFSGTQLHKLYHDYVTGVKENPGIYRVYEISVGSWRPTGALKVIGNHPELEISWGQGNNRWSYQFTMAGRFGSAASEYYVPVDDRIDTTTFFTSFYVGVDGGYSVFQSRLLDLDLIMGLGLDGMHTTWEDYDDEQRKVLISYNLNIGVRQRFYLDKFKRFYIGFGQKFNLVNYANPGGTDLSGNALSFRVSFGYVNRGPYVERMKSLNARP